MKEEKGRGTGHPRHDGATGPDATRDTHRYLEPGAVVSISAGIV